MNGYLGRDKVWNEQIWSEIDKAVREEVGRIRVAQKVFPSAIVNNVLPVARSRAVPFGAFLPVFPIIDEFQPFFEISREFQLTQAQVEGEESFRIAPSFARLAASLTANAEDTILFLGQRSIPALAAATGVAVTNQTVGIPPQFAPIPPGFVAEANNYPPIAVPPPPPPPPVIIGDILAAVANGIAALNNRAQPGPYALFVSPNNYALIFSPQTAGFLATPGDEINRVVTAGCYMVNSLAVPNLAALPPPPLANVNIGILVSLSGEPTKIILGTEAVTAFTHTDAQGNYHFRVFEPVQLVVRDGRAFQTLTF
jgi:uncharacterized linocin/CFP29 family protein